MGRDSNRDARIRGMPTATRFAPSPTGQIHLGNARTALFNWLAARHEGGRFLLRIEDTDAAREATGAADAILGDLRWLGLTWEGEPLHQSHRRDAHLDAVKILADRDRLYPCFCSEAALALARRAQQQAGQPPRYSGTCAALPAADAQARAAAGEPHVLRFRVPPGRTVSFDDRVHGEQRFATDDLGDFVVTRSDGSPAFFFVNALDDAAQGVTLVLRGDDHLSNTPRQLLVLEALGHSPPEYGHLPLMLGSSGRPMSKRDGLEGEPDTRANRAGAYAVSHLREDGYHPLALVNYLARVAGHVDSDGALPLAELARAFDPTKFSRSASRFDSAQLDHWQRATLDALSADAVWDWMGEPVHARVPAAQRDAYLALVRPNALFPGDALDWAFVLFDDAPMPQKAAVAELQGGDAAFFERAAAAYDDAMPWTAWLAAVKAATGAKGPTLFKPLRAALTGRLDGPDLAGVFALLTPARIRQRLEQARALAT